MAEGQPPLRWSVAMGFLDQARQFLIKVGLLLGGIEQDRASMPRWQAHVDEPASIANHDIAHQIAQPLAVRRFARLTACHVIGPKLFFSFEDAWFEQREKIVDFHQAILHRRR